MEVGLAVGGSILSAFLQVAFDRIASSQKLIGLFQGNRKLQLDRLERTLQTIYVVLEDAEYKQSRSLAVKRWLDRLKCAVHQADDLLDEINTERLRIRVEHSGYFDSGADFSDQFIEELMPRIKAISDTLESFASQIGVLGLKILDAKKKRHDRQPSTSVVIQSQIFGRDDEKEKIIQMVLADKGVSDISVIPITGMGGVGKTTVAQLVYNDYRVKSHYKTRAWVCVSEEFDVQRVTKDLLMEVNSSVVDDKDDLNRLQVKLKDNLEGKRFLVVLDDIWNDNYNDCQRLMIPLSSGHQGSKIIITTRNENIALMLQNEPFLYLQPIPDDQSWSLFKLHAFANGASTSLHKFETIGRAIMEKCKGLPLAIKTVAGALRSKRDIGEWHDILSSEIWMTESDVLPALSLSYEHLPSHLKCCFAFCAVFPKDIPFDKDEVALLWMANDLVQPSTQKVGRNYFEELRSRSFFEMVNGNKYLMHDLVNDLARYVSGNFSVRIEDYQSNDLCRQNRKENDLPPEVLHFSYLSNRYDTSKRFRELAHVQRLRTFLPIHQSWYQCHLTTLFLSDILPRFRSIRALSLSRYEISVVPDFIGDLKHLRFFNLSWTDIKKLPNAICKCLNLQTLILANCYYLEELPEDMRFLVNLQHLDVRGVGNAMIKRMDSWLSILKDIQNLSIVVDKIHGKVLEQLGKLQPDRSLVITGLENVVTIRSAKTVELKDMECIENLSLKWLGIAECSMDELDIFSKLQPHTNTKQLCIKRYRGTTFSNWLGDSSFSNMVVVSLRDCKNCFYLPPLGQLTALKELQICGMDGITVVGEEFYGNYSISKPFQALEELKFSTMPEWATWNTHPDIVFSSLKEFIISDCPKLVGTIPFHISSLRKFEIDRLPSLHFNQEGSLPYSPSLQVANISDLPSLKKIPQGINHLDELEVCRCPGLVSIPNHVNKLLIRDCPSLSLSLKSSDVKQLVIEQCKHLEFPTSHSCNSSLESLQIYNVGESIKAIPLSSFSKLRNVSINNWESPKLFKFHNGYHRTLTKLQSMEIYNCNNILNFPEGGLYAPNLKEFHLFYCKKLKSLPEQMLTQLPSLCYFEIEGCPEIECFPEGGLPSSLEKLYIGNCKKLKSLPEKMRTQLSSLCFLQISSCPEIEFFPEGGLSSSLETLDIRNCKKLVISRRNWGLQGLSFLTKLSINGVDDTLFPEEGLFPSSLQRLSIRECLNLEELNHKGLQHLTSLQSLSISHCPNLRYLPKERLSSSLSEMGIINCRNLESFPEEGLTSSLSRLYITHCPELKKRIESGEGEDWPKVSHIPLIYVDRKIIS